MTKKKQPEPEPYFKTEEPKRNSGTKWARPKFDPDRVRDLQTKDDWNDADSGAWN